MDETVCRNIFVVASSKCCAGQLLPDSLLLVEAPTNHAPTNKMLCTSKQTSCEDNTMEDPDGALRMVHQYLVGRGKLDLSSLPPLALRKVWSTLNQLDIVSQPMPRL